MHDPAMGLVEGGYDDPVKTGLDRPFLNARQQYTHIVDDGLTQVASGGIECALDGGTVQIAMYDVTDGIVGAPRVFKEEITLPERPTDGENGYEFGTHIFELDPVPLSDYVGRELAVAVRHDRVRLRSQNWSDGFPAEYGWGCASGDREGPLAETWQHELQDSGSAISAALFVEPVETPAGKARTVITEPLHEYPSQTVFGAFPDLTPESGMVVEYDDGTAAGAPVTVLDNGVVEIGQGSTETDSLDVSVRDADGVWHGPETLTLAGEFGPVALTAAGETIAPGGQATLSPAVQFADRLTIEELWTDWSVGVADDAGATVQDSVSEAGELTLEWSSVQNEVTPSVTVTPPAGTYVGGTYAVEVVAERDGDTAADVALVEVDPNADDQPTTVESQTSTAEDTTTLVASRGPDGSRLTSRPAGPVSHTTDGTVHLFTWDEPGPGTRAVLYDEDDSADWGGGPDIHVYDRMERPDAGAGDVPRRVATRGKWDDYSGFPALRSNSHSGEFSARIQNQNSGHKFTTTFPETTEVFLSYCVKIPDGKAMVGCEEPGEFPESSVWKMAWLYNEDIGVRDDDVDICLPSWTPTLSIGGNNLSPDVGIQDNKTPDWWLFGEWMRFSFWLECGPDPAEDPGTIRFQVVSEGQATQVVADGTDAIMEDGQPPYTWKTLDIPGWSQNKNVSGDNVEALYDDIYLATGDDANARVELSDSASYGDSTRIQLCDIRSWSSNRVSATLRKGSLDSVENAAIHLTTAGERQAVSMEVN